MSRLAYVVLLTLAACADPVDPVAPDAAPSALARLELSLHTPTVAPGVSLALELEAFDRRGDLMEPPAVIWSTTNKNAFVVLDGVVTAIAPGFSTVTASTGDITASLELEVSERVAKVTSVVIGPVEWSTLPVGGEGQLVAMAYDAFGQAMRQRRIQWSSSDPQIAAVSSEGHVVTFTTGTVSIVAECQGASSSLALRVGEPDGERGRD